MDLLICKNQFALEVWMSYGFFTKARFQKLANFYFNNFYL